MMADNKKEKSKIGDELIKAYALKNAVEHGGKAVVGSVISGLFAEGLKKEEARDIALKVNLVINDINKMPLETQKQELAVVEKLISHREVRPEGELPELPNAKEGKVIVRLAPYPSGALHIGNTKTYLLNALYAEKYNGRILFMMDDTIGSEEKQIAPEAYKLIPEAFDWLGVKYEKPIMYKSDRLNIYYKYADEIIRKEKAYVCSCDAETLRKNRADGKECGHRKHSVKENLKLWQEMFDAPEGKYVLRIKTSMKAADPAFRDRVIFRISEREHPRTGKKHRVWPLLEFSWAIDDHLLGITHVIRGKELMIESEMEKYIWDIFGWKHPELIHASLVRLEGIGAKISKSKAQKEVKEGKFFGWHDPRTWSVQSLMMRGIQSKAIRDFVIGMSLTQKEVIVPIDILYEYNRKIIHDMATQAHFYESPKQKANVEILMPNASVANGSSSDIHIKKLKDGSIVHFIGFGYCRYNPKEKIKFWFAHK